MAPEAEARTYICIDLKSYYASVECVARGLDPLTALLRTRTASDRALREALLTAFDARADHQLYVRRLGVCAGDTHNDRLQLDMFTDYAALSGYDEAVQSKQVPYVPRRQRDAEELRALNRALEALGRATRTGALARRNRERARVEYFEVCKDPDTRPSGGTACNHALTGVVRKVDPVSKKLLIGDRAIPFADIRRIALPGEWGESPR